jgi:hypothetical protein
MFPHTVCGCCQQHKVRHLSHLSNYFDIVIILVKIIASGVSHMQ